MNRAAFLVAASFAIAPARAVGNTPRAARALSLPLQTAHAKTTRLIVRHVGAFVSFRTALTPEKLAALPPIATTHDKATISAFFTAVRAAAPAPVVQGGSEQRWSVTCADEHGKSLLVITSSIFAPRDGAIGNHRVLFKNDRLVAFLAKHYAPREVDASSRP